MSLAGHRGPYNQQQGWLSHHSPGEMCICVCCDALMKQHHNLLDYFVPLTVKGSKVRSERKFVPPRIWSSLQKHSCSASKTKPFYEVRFGPKADFLNIKCFNRPGECWKKLRLLVGMQQFTFPTIQFSHRFLGPAWFYLHRYMICTLQKNDKKNKKLKKNICFTLFIRK